MRVWSIFGSMRDIRLREDEIVQLEMLAGPALKTLAQRAGDARLEAEANAMVRERRRRDDAVTNDRRRQDDAMVNDRRWRDDTLTRERRERDDRGR